MVVALGLAALGVAFLAIVLVASFNLFTPARVRDETVLALYFSDTLPGYRHIQPQGREPGSTPGNRIVRFHAELTLPAGELDCTGSLRYRHQTPPAFDLVWESEACANADELIQRSLGIPRGNTLAEIYALYGDEEGAIIQSLLVRWLREGDLQPADIPNIQDRARLTQLANIP